MTSLYVLDASALLCLLYRETGSDRVEAVMARSELSTVNYAEVVTKLVEHGRYDEETQADLASLIVDLVPLDHETGRLAGLMRAQTREAGLSLGDRCCLALAKLRGATAMTTDRAWAVLDLGVTIELVR